MPTRACFCETLRRPRSLRKERTVTAMPSLSQRHGIPMGRRVLAATSLMVTLMVLLAVLYREWSPVDASTPSQSLESDGANPVAARPDSRVGDAPAQRQSAPPAQARIHVVDADGVAIPGVAIWCDAQLNEHGADLGTLPAGTTDERGRLLIPLPRPGSTCCAKKPGYLVEAFQTEGVEETTVVLNRSRTLELLAAGPIGPVADCSVFVSLLDAIPAAGVSRINHGSEGVLSASNPVWQGRTDRSGRCALDTPADRPLWVSVFHDAFYPCERWALALEPIPAASEPFQGVIAMRDMLGIAVAVPDDATITSHIWEYDHRARCLEVGAMARYRYCQEALQKKMPNHAVGTFAVNTPGVGDEVSFAGLDNLGREWALDWKFVPIRTLTAPVFPIEVPSTGSAVVDVVFELNGRRIEGTPMLLGKMSRSGKPLLLSIRSGAVLTVPAGDYWVELDSPLGFGPDIPTPPPTSVLNGARATLACSVPHELIRVDVSPTVLGDTLDRTVVVSLESGDTSIGTMWRRERDPLVYWLPPGDYAMQAATPGYSVARRSLRVSSGDGPSTINDLVLRR